MSAPPSHQEELNAMIKEAFDMFDKDGSGAISASEMQEALDEKLNIKINEQESKEIVKTLDKDGSGQVDYDEFVAFVKDLLQQTRAEKIQRLNEVFRFYDQDGDGYITKEEIKKGMQESYGQMTDEEAEKIIQNIGDSDQDGKINFQEFSEGYL